MDCHAVEYYKVLHDDLETSTYVLSRGGAGSIPAGGPYFLVLPHCRDVIVFGLCFLNCDRAGDQLHVTFFLNFRYPFPHDDHHFLVREYFPLLIHVHSHIVFSQIQLTFKGKDTRLYIYSLHPPELGQT